MKRIIRNLTAKFFFAKPLYHAIKQRSEELRRRRAQDQLRKKQPIIRQGSPECFERLPLRVSWDVTSFCNFRCSYCYYAGTEYKKDFCTLEQAETAIKHLALANRPNYTVSLLGGEPTTHPHLAEIITLFHKHLGDRLDCLMIFSNGTFSEKQIDAILSAGTKLRFKLIISVHLEYMSINKVVELVKRLSNQTYMEMRVLFQPDLFEKTVAMADTLCNLRKDYPFYFEIGMIREAPFFSKIDSRYTPEHFEWAEKMKKRFDEVALEGVKCARAYPITMEEEFLVEINVRDVVENHKQISRSELKNLTGNCFTGMTCVAGTNCIKIKVDGRVRGILCGLDRFTCNIFEENPFLREDWMHGVFCTRAICGCGVNYPFPKFKSPADAQRFIAEKKLEQKKLMGDH